MAIYESYLYIANAARNGGNNAITQCTINPTTGALSACVAGVADSSSLALPSAITFAAGSAYVTSSISGVQFCNINGSGLLSGCQNTTTPGNIPTPISISSVGAGGGTWFYMATNSNATVVACPKSGMGGSFSYCSTPALDNSTSISSYTPGAAVDSAGDVIYIINGGGTNIIRCNVSYGATPTFSSCSYTATSGLIDPEGIYITY